MNILEKQALKLIKERDFSVKDAVKLAYSTQKRRWFVKGWILTHRWKLYWELSSDEREIVRRAVSHWAKLNDFIFVEWKAIYIPKV